MSKKIAIVGAGTAGLHLGLYLLQHDVDATIFTDRRPEEYAGMRLLNTVAHHHVTVAREDALGVNHWPHDGYFGHYYYIGVQPQPLQFFADLEAPSRAVDYRIYQPQLMQDFLDRSGRIEYQPVIAEDLESLSTDYDVVVVCTGKGSMGEVFGRDETYSPHHKPQRQLCVGLFKGIREPETRAVTMYFSPGAGELIEIPTLTFNGMAAALVFENIPGGSLEVLAKTRYDEHPRAFLDLMLDKVRTHYPTLAGRINEAEFDLANGPLDILQGGVTPTVRNSHATLSNGKIAIALGDVHATVDPVLGQGANMASHAAWILGEEIVANEVFDERFVEHLDRRRNDRVISATRWTNYMLANLETLPEGLVQYIIALSQDNALANLFTENFNYPERQWDCFASPARTGAWVVGNATRTDARPLAAAGAPS